ncbi:MAG: hypothetical protein LBC70_06050 [Chitinispirillales bacterium]|jgi:hypothetical protein|nr:hypothetical protein [Chitinispirillales bacterium]
MIAVNVGNIAELYDTGLQVLNDNLGEDAARAFLSLPFPGRGDYTAAKQARPPRTPAEMAEMKALIIEDAKARGLPV